MTELRFDDRVAVVTGAGRGLGRSYALLLASRGARVVVNDTGTSLTGDGADPGPADEVVREIEAAGGQATACTESVATAVGGQAIIQAALDHFGRIDVLIHNAGTVRRASLTDMSYDDFDAVLDVHLRGAFHVVRPAFPLMRAARYGRIVLTSSIGGLYGNHDVANYAVAKAGVIGLSNVVALEGAADDVKCNVIVPSAVTRMAEGLDTSAYPPMGPEQVAPVVGLAGSPVLLDHRRNADRHRRAGGPGSGRRIGRGVPTVMVDRRRRRKSGCHPGCRSALGFSRRTRWSCRTSSLQLRSGREGRGP